MTEVYPIGTEVVIDSDIPAVIVAFEVRGTVGLVTYQCRWWDERTRKTEWLNEDEIKPKNPTPKRVISIR